MISSFGSRIEQKRKQDIWRHLKAKLTLPAATAAVNSNLDLLLSKVSFLKASKSSWQRTVKRCLSPGGELIYRGAQETLSLTQNHQS